MRNKSHAAMGRFLLREYFPGISGRNATIFLLGCTQPDKNPTTYLKGSIRSRWMRGHNYSNSSRYIMRLSKRLEKKSHFTPWDYYSLGKLIHYTMDAFTYAHDERFPQDLHAHRQYEAELQHYFLANLRRCRKPADTFRGSCAALIRETHMRYIRLPGSVETDTAYAFSTCCQLMRKMTGNTQH